MPSSDSTAVSTTQGEARRKNYTRRLLFIAGMGGLLYGVDIGIISSALLYLNKTVNLTEQQVSFIVAAVLGGSMVSSLVAGILADLFGRKKMLIVSAFFFVASVGVIVLSRDFASLITGRFLQGISGGVIAVVVPLYLAECLSSYIRGKGAVIFQFMLTFGIVVASLAGLYFIRQAEATITAAGGDATLILAAQNHAWRSMFFFVIFPGLIFLAGTFMVSESPRWLFRRNRREQALAALRLSCSDEEVEREWREMTAENAGPENAAETAKAGPLWQWRYIAPFLLACVILGCTQATGVNSILQFLTIILRQAGMDADSAAQGDLAVKVLNCAMTLVAIGLVDRKGRRFLLKIGTGGIVIALLATTFLFHGFEAQRSDVRDKVQAAIVNDSVSLAVTPETFGPAVGDRPMCLTVLYRYGDGDQLATVLSTDPNPRLSLTPAATTKSPGPLEIKRAQYGPVPSPLTDWLVMACLSLYIASFSVGPGVCVWLALSELMPTRIRSMGMGVALLINQGVSTAIAATFLPIVGNHGYAAIFLFCAACSLVFFLVVTFFLPETKGKTLEEIEEVFTGHRKS